MGRLNPSRETKFSGVNGDRELFISPVQLTTSRIGNFIRLIHTLLYVMTIHIYIHTYHRDGRKRSAFSLRTLADHLLRLEDIDIFGRV